jgi:CheY-like chemotaxis protein
VEVTRTRAHDPALETAGLRPDDDYVRVSVLDNGVGMDASTRERIFEPFFTTKERGQGTGLGLSTTRAIISELCGSITCESRPGAGSRFDIYLPRSSQLATRAPSARTPAPVGNNETILVIDDEPSVRTAVARLLGRQGYSVRVAAGGAEAIAMFQRGETDAPIDLILLDLSMPGMSGRLVHDELRRLAPDTPIAYFTGYAREAPGAADAWIEKPIVGDQIMHVVREMLDRGA